MVQVRAHQPINTDGSINLEAWLDHTVSVDMALDREGISQLPNIIETRRNRTP